MARSEDDAIEQVRLLKSIHENEREQLDQLRRYWKGRQGLVGVMPSTVPNEVRRMARMARVNVISIVVDTLAQATFVDGFRAKDEADDLKVWDTWQANKMDARQSGIHRAAFAYGASYAVVLPGDTLPVIRGVSPRNLCAVYGGDPDWPMMALERLGPAPDGSRGWRLYDEEASYFVAEMASSSGEDLRFVETREHGLGVTPVVRYLDQDDLDADDDVEPSRTVNEPEIPNRGQVAPLMSIQDQIDLTTFGLLIAQWYSAFRQRYVVGWTSADENKAMKTAASQLWTFDEDPENMKLGEFEQTDLKGYIESREASLKHAATLSQTPVHELVGSLINLSAEALAAAEAGKDRKVDERETLLGESHEQMLGLVGQLQGVDVPPDAQVVWRDTSARSFAATVDALGKLVTMLGIPQAELWERVPGATKQDVMRWKAAAKDGDSFAALSDMLERQMTDPTANGGGQPAPAFG